MSNKEGEELQINTEKLNDLDIEDKHNVPEIQPINVKYCEICRFPEEFCEYTHSIFAKGINNLAIQNLNEKKENEPKKENEENKPKEGDDKDKETAEKAKKEKKDKKADTKKVEIKVSKRGSKKYATHVFNLELFNLNLKDVAKLFSKKFACSSTVSKENNKDCIVLTGEFTYEIVDFLKEKFPGIISEDNCHVSEAK